MTEEEARDLFSEAYEGSLSSKQADEFEAMLEKNPAIRSAYDQFCALFSSARFSGEGAPGEGMPGGEDPDPNLKLAPPPDLLPAVQEKLFLRSRGRYYRDRFSRGRGNELWMATSAAGLILLLVAAVWFAMHRVQVELPSPDVPPQRSDAVR